MFTVMAIYLTVRGPSRKAVTLDRITAEHALACTVHRAWRSCKSLERRVPASNASRLA